MNVAPNNFREEDEPVVRQGAVYLPMWLIGLLAVLIYWGFNYVDAHGGNYDELVYEPYHSTNEVASMVPMDEVAIQFKMGKDAYQRFCEVCHQAHGGGSVGVAPPLAGSEWVLAPTANRIARIPLRGLTGPVKVKDNDFNLTMFAVAAGGAMTDEQVAAVLTYIRSSWGNKASAVPPELVKKVQSEIKDHPGPFTAEELLKVPLSP